MKAGQTELEVGTRVQLHIKGKDDQELNGLIGTVTHPFAFGCTKKGWVGIYLEAGLVKGTTKLCGEIMMSYFTTLAMKVQHEICPQVRYSLYLRIGKIDNS